MLNRSILSNGFLLLVLSLLFVACEKESLEPTTEDFTTENLTIDESSTLTTSTTNIIDLTDEEVVNSISTPCYEVLFPVKLVFPNGRTIEINDEDELREAIRRWVDANPNTDRRPQIAFPYRVVLQNGDTVAVRNANTLRRIIYACNTDRPSDRPCYRILYPVTIAFPGGATLEVGSAEEFARAIRRWLDAHPDAARRPHIAFPYRVQLSNGNVVAIENARQLKRLIQSCRPDGPGNTDGNPCYKVIFPATLAFPNGATLEVNSQREMVQAIARWKKSHPNATRHPQLAFPYRVELANGTIVAIDSEDALKCLRNYCADNRPDRPSIDRPCYRVVYPAILAFPDGNTIRVSSDRERIQASIRWVQAPASSWGIASAGSALR